MAFRYLAFLLVLTVSIDGFARVRASEEIAKLRHEKAAKRIKSADELENIKITTLNLGFLNLLKLDILKVPEYETRLKFLEQTLQEHLGSSKASDIVSLQEVWHEDAFLAVCQLAEKHNYMCLSNGHDEVDSEKKYTYSQHGLVVLVRRDFLVDGGQIQFSFLPFYDGGSFARAYLDYFAGVMRGVLLVKVLNGQKNLLVMNTHFTALVSSNSIRRKQVKSLLKYVEEYKKDFDYVFVAGDLNLSPTFEFSLPGVERDGTPEQWEENAKNYDLLVSNERASLIDSFRAIHLAEPGYTQDRTKNDLTKQSSSTKSEPEQRLDYILYTSSNKGCEIRNSGLAATEPLIEGDKVAVSKMSGARIFPSDHFGVSTEFSCL